MMEYIMKREVFRNEKNNHNAGGACPDLHNKFVRGGGTRKLIH